MLFVIHIEKQDSRKYDDLLVEYVQNKFSVVLLCGSTQFVFELIMAANRLGFTNGEYVFINFDMYAQMHSSDRLVYPWKEIKQKEDMNNIWSAYEILLTVSLKVDDSDGKFGHFQKKLLHSNPKVFKEVYDVSYNFLE